MFYGNAANKKCAIDGKKVSRKRLQSDRKIGIYKLNSIYLQKSKNMETALFYSETPVIKGKDAKRLLNAMENVKPLPKEQVEEMQRDYQNYLSRRVGKKHIL